MLDKILLLPPIVFLILLAVGYVISLSFTKLAIKGHESAGKLEQYACGEDIPAQNVRPDYSQFFPFAIFFTIMHVVALILTTMPKDFSSGYILAAVFICSALVGLLILFRR
jgi:NADH:ubiquinone oxidoreductase subunit 3 (subunit A)